tara:strand:- start:1309 stop:2673 length:1365 start_codon:yes stop_codon:yes gene_type:complete
MSSIFSEEALKKRRIPGDLAGPITLLTPPLKASLFFAFGLVAVGVLWSIYARVPITIKAIGVLVPVSTIDSVSSKTNGTAEWIFNQKKKPWHKKVFQFKSSPDEFDVNEVISLAKTILYESGNLDDNLNQNDDRAQETIKKNSNILGTKISKGSLIMWIKPSSFEQGLVSELMKWNDLEATTQQKLQNLTNQKDALSKEFEARSASIDRLKILEGSGISKNQLLDEISRLDNVKFRILNVESEMLVQEERKLSGFLKIKNKIAEVIDQQFVFAVKNIYLYQVIPSDGSDVASGEPIIKTSEKLVRSPSFIPVFVGNTDKSSVTPGMRALVTPVGFNRAEFGGIRSEVAAVAKIPSTFEDINARIGIRSLSEEINNKTVAPGLVVLKLLKSDNDSQQNSGGYRWSTTSSLPFEPRAGTKVDVDITTRYVSPISMVLPTLKKFVGLATPSTNNKGT